MSKYTNKKKKKIVSRQHWLHYITTKILIVYLLHCFVQCLIHLFSVLSTKRHKSIKEVFKKKGHSVLKVIVGKYFTITYQVNSPKMKILSSFTHLHIVSFLCWTYNKIFWRMLVISWWSLLTSLVFVSYYGSQWWPTTVWFFKILQNILFYVEDKKETYIGLEQHEGE